ncbi:MAG TPA: 4'-phosphopantetheinyl transferase superfamily protein [Candidatus Competibacteraceae bacterium]|nr:4'-phosphopantetheinyl transferase superfamily protein [Candidatus Competibacteraceae bacterium]
MPIWQPSLHMPGNGKHGVSTLFIDDHHSMLEQTPVLAANEIHLWLANLQPSPERLARLAATLTVDERERAARFRFPGHRDRFIAGRGLLRELLGAYLNRMAAALRFSQGPRGKPVLADEHSEGLHFNLSHSSGRVLYAIAYHEVGVDLEAMDRRLDYMAVAERICTPREWAFFQTLPAEQARESFFACWTRKEAVAKALGDGLAHGLNKLDAGFQEDEQADKRISLQDAAGQEWSVQNLPLEPGWAGALAAPPIDWHWRMLTLGELGVSD